MSFYSMTVYCLQSMERGVEVPCWMEEAGEESEVPGGVYFLVLLLKSELQVLFSLRQLQMQPQHLGLLHLEEQKEIKKDLGVFL